MAQDDLRQWAQRHETSREIAEAIFSIASKRRDAEAIWEAPTSNEQAAVLDYVRAKIRAGDCDNGIYYWGIERYTITVPKDVQIDGKIDAGYWTVTGLNEIGRAWVAARIDKGVAGAITVRNLHNHDVADGEIKIVDVETIVELHTALRDAGLAVDYVPAREDNVWIGRKFPLRAVFARYYKRDDRHFIIHCDRGSGSGDGEAGVAVEVDDAIRAAYSTIELTACPPLLSDDEIVVQYASEWIAKEDGNGYEYRIMF